MSATVAESGKIDPRVMSLLACPACHGALLQEPERLVCAACGRAYPIVDGIPVLVAERAAQAAEAAPARTRLPNGGLAQIDLEKLTDYCLDPAHPRGRHKARVFRVALALTVADAMELQQALAEAAANGDAQIGASDKFGKWYIIDFELSRLGKTAQVRSCWIVRAEEAHPRFVTCFVL